VKPKPLTAAQQRILDRAQKGTCVYNGSAKVSIEELERRRLVWVKWDQNAENKGNGMVLTWRITVALR
jgi:hypothetical protein